MNPYDIEEAFAGIEEELIASMMRNMKRHKVEEIAEDKQWSMWQAEQLKSLEKYKQQNRKKFQKPFSDINGSIDKIVKQAKKSGSMEQEIAIMDAIKKGWKPPAGLQKSTQISAEFFKLNERKLEALIKATTQDFTKAEHAMLRMADDQYRKIIFNAQVYANTGAGTYKKAVDMATKDFLTSGINCIEYANGARHTIKDYAAMAIQTAAKRAYLTGEGEKRQEWGVSTVIMNKRGNPCPKCLPFVGKILIDDVWSGGKSSDGSYKLMSSAISAGLYHPRCKDSHTTYFPGISTPPDDKFTQKEIKEIEKSTKEDVKQQNAQRQTERFRRLADYSLDPYNKRMYEARADEWSAEAQLKNRYKDSEGIYQTYNINQGDVIKPHNIKNNILKSEIGKQISEYLENENVTVKLLYGIDNPGHLYGYYDPIDDEIAIYADLTKTVEKTTEVLIHEATHRKYKIGDDQWSEAVCIAQEIKHRKRSNTLTAQEKRDIIKTTKKLYPHFSWKKKG